MWMHVCLGIIRRPSICNSLCFFFTIQDTLKGGFYDCIIMTDSDILYIPKVSSRVDMVSICEQKNLHADGLSVNQTQKPQNKSPSSYSKITMSLLKKYTISLLHSQTSQCSITPSKNMLYHMDRKASCTSNLCNII
jgi:hypothetical protein